jgi:hypothetical protein
MEESIDEAAKTQQVFQRADRMSIPGNARSSFGVSPVCRDQRLTSVWKNDHELQTVRHACLPEYFERLSFKRVMRTGNGHSLRKALMMGSVWWFPLTI